MAIRKIGLSAKTKRINNDLTPDQKTYTPEKKEKAEAIPIEESLEREKNRFLAFMKTKKLSLTEKIKQTVMAYNQVMYQIVRSEEEQELQYDQYIQHFFMAKHKEFLVVGISIQKSIYLEFNAVEIRHAIDEYGEERVENKLFGDKGLFIELLAAIENTISKMENSQIDIGKSGRRFDYKA